MQSNQPQKQRRVDLNLDDLPNDPGLRRQISKITLMIKIVRRGIWKRPFFSRLTINLCEFLIMRHNEEGGEDAFTTEEFRSWKKTKKLEGHVRNPISAYNKACQKADNLINQKQAFKQHFQDNHITLEWNS